MQEPQRIAFGEWLPDIAPLANPGLRKAMNVVPTASGYDGIGSLQAITGFSVIAAAPKGALAEIDSRGNPFNFVGTTTKLYRLSTTDDVEDMTRLTGGDYNCSEESRWEFELFDDTVIACNINDLTQGVNVRTGSNFIKLGNATSQAPRAAHVGIIGTFVVFGNTYDNTNGRDPAALHWSALNDQFNYPEPRTEAAVAVQSDRQHLSGKGGAIQRVISGAEVAAVMQERAIWRAEYRGGDIVFELDRVEPNRGLLIPAIAVPFGRHVFYSSEDGFYLFNYTTSEAVGRERVDRFFLGDVKPDYFHRVSAVKDPNTQRIWITYPGSGSELQSDKGAPNKLLMYDWGLNKFTEGDEAVELLVEVVDQGVHLDSPAPADGSDPNEVDTAGLASFDARIAGVGGRKLGGYTSGTWQISDFAGLMRNGTLETGSRELFPSKRSTAHKARPLVDGVNPTVQAASLSKANQSVVFSRVRPLDQQGDAPLRTDARYHAFRVNLPPGFSNAIAMDVYASVTGDR